MHGDAHIVDHRNDVFDLLGVHDTFGQVIVDLGVGEVSLLFTLCNQQFKSGLLLVEIHVSTYVDNVIIRIGLNVK